MDKFTIASESSISDAMKLIDSNSSGSCVLLDKNDLVLAIVTDGDIRRSLLDGFTLSDEVLKIANFDFKYVFDTDSLKYKHSLVNEGYSFIPVLDETRKLVDVITRHRPIKFPIANISFKGNELLYVNECLSSGWISSQGLFVNRFENEFSEFVKSDYGLAVSNGTVAIQLALSACGIGHGDKVLVPDFTFAATINAVIAVGAIPIIGNVDKDRFGLEINNLNPILISEIKAIIAVHIYGAPCQIEKISKFCQSNEIVLIEDCAEAIGTYVNNKHVGLFGDAATFSFFGNKTITTGEGGMILFRDSKTYSRAKKMRDHGMSEQKKYYHDIPGFNYRLTNLQSAIGVAQLEEIDFFLGEKTRIARLYSKDFEKISQIIKPYEVDSEINSHWLYALRIKGLTLESRDKVIESLQTMAIQCRPFFYPLSSMTPFKKYCQKDLQYKTNEISDIGICLPTYPNMKNSDINIISGNLISALESLEIF